MHGIYILYGNCEQFANVLRKKRITFEEKNRFVTVLDQNDFLK